MSGHPPEPRKPASEPSARRRISKVLGHLASKRPISLSRCKSCVHRHDCTAQLQDIEDMGASCRFPARAHMLKLLENRAAGAGLAGELFYDPDMFEADKEMIFHKEWLFAGHELEILEPGSWTTLQAGNFPVLLVRGRDNQVRGFHNVCRHRGFKLCPDGHGKTERNLVCQYHQWTYDIDSGRLIFARDMDDAFEPSLHGLVPVHLEIVATYMFVCVADTPPDFEPLRKTITKYAEPYRLEDAKVAHQSRIVEKGNWKLVWENNRECYHCHRNHPELSNSFPANWVQSKDGDRVEAADRLTIPSEFECSEDLQFRVMRHNFVKGSRSMTVTGEPAIQNGKRLGRMPRDENVGNMPFYHYPSTWNHWQADYAVSFRVAPLSPTETEVVTTWLVPKHATEGVDYELKELVKVWEETNKQDQLLVERVQSGVRSPAFVPGQYNLVHETGVMEFVEWYASRMTKRLTEQ